MPKVAAMCWFKTNFTLFLLHFRNFPCKQKTFKLQLERFFWFDQQMKKKVLEFLDCSFLLGRYDGCLPVILRRCHGTTTKRTNMAISSPAPILITNVPHSGILSK